MTRAETLLWRYLKAHHVGGLPFRRQVPMGEFIADFVCHAARTIVEIDGESHDFEDRRLHDYKRDEWFRSQHYVVLRFTNEQVLKNLEGVIVTIRETAAGRLRQLPPSLALPHKGGGNSSRRQGHSRTPSLPSPASGGGEVDPRDLPVKGGGEGCPASERGIGGAAG